uniref:RIN4 pathogenic type III effector avirulence factor Avr cleavage site domain-containing protein n=2 Tax=Aegilops tauschii subsp. strangulata TaxID=200361 RepID=A0A453NP53_AEGTS
MAGKGPVVPKFGSWDAENIGYTVFFEKVRENKAAPVPGTAAPPAAPAPRGHDDQEFDPYEYYENLSRNVPSRAPSSHGHQAPAQHYDHLGGNVPSRPPSSHGHGHPSPAQHYPAQHGHPSPAQHYPAQHGHPSPAQHYPAQHGHGGYHRRNG